MFLLSAVWLRREKEGLQHVGNVGNLLKAIFSSEWVMSLSWSGGERHSRGGAVQILERAGWGL